MYKLNNIDEYMAYFENIAAKNKRIKHSANSKHFCAFESVEVDTGLKGKSLNYPALVIEYNEGVFGGPNELQLNEKLTCAFWVTMGAVKLNDYKGILSALKESKDIGYEILSRMHKDAKAFLIQGFDITGTRYIKIGPMWDGFYFYRFEFDLVSGVADRICYDNTKWLGE